MKELELSGRGKGLKVLLDDEWYEYVSKWKWTLNNNGYPHRRTYVRGSKKKYATLFLHRLVAGAVRGQVVDHIDHDKLNCQSFNLRTCNQAQNHWWSRKHRDNVSGFKGVARCSQTRSWKVEIAYLGTHIHIGRFKDVVEAGYIYDQVSYQLHGEFAFLNTPFE